MWPVPPTTVRDKPNFRFFTSDEGDTSYMFTAEDGTLWRYDETVGDYVQRPQEEVSDMKSLNTSKHKTSIVSTHYAPDLL